MEVFLITTVDKENEHDKQAEEQPVTKAEKSDQ